MAIRHKFNNIAAIIEFKVEKDKDLILKGSSQKALSQIIEKKYAMQFFKRGCDRVICIGMAFRQKECQLIIQTITDEGDL
ncbi:PD-(D/E)XK nuclease domain-containing protein [Anaerobiospirillum thomasii]|uniref:PD-(D/E)XK nuclease domain-containing protein n=1 Tax=Anaerobiospirillum thomasii TaxID=179995 RepID=UPI000DE59D7D